MMTDEQATWMKKMQAPCACGSGKKAEMCCAANEAKSTACPCGSGKMYFDCCMENPEAHKA